MTATAALKLRLTDRKLGTLTPGAGLGRYLL